MLPSAMFSLKCSVATLPSSAVDFTCRIRHLNKNQTKNTARVRCIAQWVWGAEGTLTGGFELNEEMRNVVSEMWNCQGLWCKRPVSGFFFLIL